MLWSSRGDHHYAQGIACSTSGTIKGCEARTLLFIVHDAEGNGPRKPQIWRVYDSGTSWC